MARRLLERGSDDLVRLVDGRGEVPSPRLGVLDEVREPRMHFGATKRICRLVGTCGE